MVLGLLATLAAALSLSAPIGYGFLGRMEAPTGRTLGTLPASVAPSAFRLDEIQLQFLHGIHRWENRSSNSVDQPTLSAGGHLGAMGTAFLSPTCSRFDLLLWTSAARQQQTATPPRRCRVRSWRAPPVVDACDMRPCGASPSGAQPHREMRPLRGWSCPASACRHDRRRDGRVLCPDDQAWKYT